MKTIAVNGMEFMLGLKWLHKIVNAGTIDERREKTAITENERDEIKKILTDNDLLQAEKWHKIARLYSEING
jgi:adenylate kinase